MRKFFVFAFLCLAILQVAPAEDVPEKCKAPPPFVEKPHECCNLPPLFKSEDLDECGFHHHDGHGPPPPFKHDKPPGPPPKGSPPCEKHICILKKNNLMKDDEHIDRDGLKTYLENWGKENPDFASTLSTVTDKCLKEEIPGPPELCEPIKTVMCAATVMFTDCPIWNDTENCKMLKDYINECKEFIHHEPK